MNPATMAPLGVNVFVGSVAYLQAMFVVTNFAPMGTFMQAVSDLHMESTSSEVEE